MAFNIISTGSVFIQGVFTFEGNDIIISTATGFFVDLDFDMKGLVTNKHVVTGTDFFTNKVKSIPNKLIINYSIYDQIKGVVKPFNLSFDLLLDNKPIWFESFNKKSDVIIIPLNNLGEVYTYSLEKDNYFELSVTKELFVIGYPYGKKTIKNMPIAIWSKGSVASEPDFDFTYMDNEYECYLIDCKTRGGQSGSPVIYYSEDGIISTKGTCVATGKEVKSLCGIYSGRLNEKSDLGIVWKKEIINRIIININATYRFRNIKIKAEEKIIK